MFILSIVPIHLAISAGGAVNNSDEIDVSEHNVMELEGLLSSLILKQYLGAEVAGVDNNDQTAVSQMLTQERNNLLNQASSSPVEINKDDANARLTELTRDTSWINTRIKDLQGLSNYLSGNGPNPGYYVSGVINTDLTKVNAELNRAMLYKQMLQETTTFWTEMINVKVTQSSNSGALGDATSSGSTNQASNTTTSSGSTNQASNTTASSGSTNQASDTTASSGSTNQASNTTTSSGSTNQGSNTTNSSESTNQASNTTTSSGSTNQTTSSGSNDQVDNSNTSNSTDGTSKNDEPEYDNRLTLLAMSKNRIVELSSLLNSLMYKESAETIAAKEKNIMSDLSREINKARTYLNGTGGNSRVVGLESELKNIQDEKENSIAVEALQGSVSNELTNVIHQYYANLGAFNI